MRYDNRIWHDGHFWHFKNFLKELSRLMSLYIIDCVSKINHVSFIINERRMFIIPNLVAIRYCSLSLIRRYDERMKLNLIPVYNLQLFKILLHYIDYTFYTHLVWIYTQWLEPTNVNKRKSATRIDFFFHSSSFSKNMRFHNKTVLNAEPNRRYIKII